MARFMSIDAACKTNFKAAHDSGPRKKSDVRYIVIHSTEGDTAAGAASWFANKASEGSANLVVDDDECYKTVDGLRIPWAAPGKNTDGFHIEIAGYAHWSKTEWMKHTFALKRAAYKAALWAAYFDVPCVKRNFIGLRLRRRGFCGHRDVSYAYPIQARAAGFHTDPGVNFPWPVFMKYVSQYRKQFK